MQKIRKDDLVKIIAGKDKGKTGKVLKMELKKDRVLVEGCNMITKHAKPSAKNVNGGIITQEAPLHISNVMLVVDGQPTRVGFEVRDGKKVRVARKTGKVIG
ncbi:MAG: 50S ribosomal protein L24 [Lachnospiraceae bacterium]|jgi:large subunit ribosomal protein L24|nr:50S ribosomal protein L24 [Lachnospiraceae bacterium]